MSDENDDVTLTRAELEEQLNAAGREREKAAREDERAKFQAERETAKADAERAAAEEQGKFKELADKERGRAEKAEADLAAQAKRIRLRDIKDKVADHLRTSHAGYEGGAEFVYDAIRATLSDDPDGDKKLSDDAAIDAMIAAKSKAFAERVKPAQPPGAGGAKSGPTGAPEQPNLAEHLAKRSANTYAAQKTQTDTFGRPLSN